MRRPTQLLAPSRSLRARVRRFIVERDLLRPDERVLVGVSGGPDSTCLLITLAALRRSLKIDVLAAYFDHGLRGARAAQRERRYVEWLAESLGVPLRCGAGDVRAHARKARRSIEEAARELRYRFLAAAARESGCDAVAVGHTRDDQAETVLLHLIRGSGTKGLSGMAASASWPVRSRGEAPRLVRPLLGLSRAETVGCCREAGLRPIADPSNRSPAHLRNRIRRELLPLLRHYNPRVDDALVRLADAAASDVELLESLAAGALVSMPAEDGAARLDRKRLLALPDALQRHAVRLAVERSLGDARGLSERHVRAVLRASSGPTGASLDLARGLGIDVRRAFVELSTKSRTSSKLPPGEVALPAPGSAQIGPWRIEASVLRRRPRDVTATDGGRRAYLDADAVDGLTLRRRRPGDRFHPLGLARPKKLQDFLVDAHVPREERDALPLVCSSKGIVWVVTQRPAEWAKVSEGTRSVLQLRATRRAP